MNNVPNELILVVSARPTILIVDDDAGICSALSLLIESFGWNAQAFGSAETFLDAFTPAPSQCLLLDLNLPGMSGVQQLKELATWDIDIPTIIITARPDSPAAREAKATGALAVLTKPFTTLELLPIVETAVEHKAAEV